MTLLTSLITMVGTTNRSVGNTCSLLFLGACRIDDGTEELVLRHLLQEFDTTNSIQMSRISLKGFEVKSLNEMMSEVLCLPRRKTRSLSQVIEEKTQGMPLFVVEVRTFVHTFVSCFFLLAF
jgi:ATP-dependent RNA helicase DDX31/DBP7